METDIKEIKETIKAIATKPNTWAEVAANTDGPTIRAEIAKKERLEKAKSERDKSNLHIEPLLTRSIGCPTMYIEISPYQSNTGSTEWLQLSFHLSKQ